MPSSLFPSKGIAQQPMVRPSMMPSLQAPSIPAIQPQLTQNQSNWQLNLSKWGIIRRQVLGLGLLCPIRKVAL